MDESNGIQKVVSLHLAHSCRYSQASARSGRRVYHSRKLAHSPSYSPASVGGEGIIPFDRTPALSAVV